MARKGKAVVAKATNGTTANGTIPIPAKAWDRLATLIAQAQQADALVRSHLETTMLALDVPAGYRVDVQAKAFVKGDG